MCVCVCARKCAYFFSSTFLFLCYFFFRLICCGVARWQTSLPTLASAVRDLALPFNFQSSRSRATSSAAAAAASASASAPPSRVMGGSQNRWQKKKMHSRKVLTKLLLQIIKSARFFCRLVFLFLLCCLLFIYKTRYTLLLLMFACNSSGKCFCFCFCFFFFYISLHLVFFFGIRLRFGPAHVRRRRSRQMPQLLCCTLCSFCCCCCCGC